ncbi:DUF6153 family protein [Kitasatospora sp. GP82]|uniref:DUF6153 family protein n=1 Tax=Kitasatospora sp. GP82 TaxID=3035089 RepID=UPI0024730689|nr:DUF6153 family protein [Kitasatospora sp. GP82]MDH6125688.1 hypothetical protein [Kitasatospora sp. GP82]
MDTLTPRLPVTGHGRWTGARTLAVLVLLLGLLGMHGLADPGGAMADPAHTGQSRSQQVVRMSMAPGPSIRADHGPCDCDEHHHAHAGSICQAPGLGSAPDVPPLRPVLDRSFCDSARSIADAPAQPAAGRGPPSLSALQLLRI